MKLKTKLNGLNFMKEVNYFRRSLLHKAEDHTNTVMLGYTFLQHAEPVTFAFYLLSWVHQFERNFERCQGAYKHTDISPAGCAVLTTTAFPLNRKRTQELLGFKDIFTNARDAILSTDFLQETSCCLADAATVLTRFADDLSIWHSSEFGMVEIPDAYCGTSSIMPQKKNPDGTSAVRGLASYVIGDLMALLALNKAQSDSTEIGTMAMPPLFDAFNNCVPALQIMSAIAKDLKVNEELMMERASMFWATASSLVHIIVTEKKIPFRQAHHVVAVLVRLAYESGTQVKDVTPEMVDNAARECNCQPLNLKGEVLHKALDPVGGSQEQEANWWHSSGEGEGRHRVQSRKADCGRKIH